MTNRRGPSRNDTGQREAGRGRHDQQTERYIITIWLERNGRNRMHVAKMTDPTTDDGAVEQEPDAIGVWLCLKSNLESEDACGGIFSDDEIDMSDPDVPYCFCGNGLSWLNGEAYRDLPYWPQKTTSRIA